MSFKSLNSFINWKNDKANLNLAQKEERLIKMFDEIGIEIKVGKENDINNPNFSARINQKHFN